MQLIAGSEDGHIRIFKDDHIVFELKETDAVTALIALPNCSFGYALTNGTVGVYQKKKRLWSIKVFIFVHLNICI